MAKRWTWAILSAIWLAAAILNYFDRRSGMLVLFNLEAAAIFLLLTICQCICDKRGAAGEKIMKKILMAVFVLLLLSALLIVLL